MASNRVAVARHDHVPLCAHRENHLLVLGDGLIEFADLAHQIRQCDLAEGGQPAAVFDFVIRNSAVMMAKD